MGIGATPFGATPFGSTLIVSNAAFFVGNWSPELGFAVERLQFVAFDVLDFDQEAGVPIVTGVKLRAIQGGIVEDIWSAATGFTPRYYRGSGRERINNGFHYILRRTGGWLSNEVNIDVIAFDANGQVVRGTSES